MAERLTDYFECGAYTSKENIIDVSDKVKFFDNGCVMGKAIYKLAQLEDILEKYGIESVEELEDKIICYEENKDVNLGLKLDIKKLEQELDTWKRACELACKWFKQTGFIGDQTEVDYYYQQAKKEGEQK